MADMVIGKLRLTGDSTIPGAFFPGIAIPDKEVTFQIEWVFEND